MKAIRYRMNAFRKKNKVLTAYMYIPIILMLISISIGIHNLEYLSDAFFLLSLFFIGVFHLLFICSKYSTAFLLKQINIVAFTAFCFVFILIIFNHDNIKIYTSISCLIVTGFVACTSFFKYIDYTLSFEFLSKINYISKVKYLLAGCLFIGFTVFELSSFPKADADYYFKATQNAIYWNFSLDNSLSYLKFGNHASYGCSIFMLIGHLIFPRDGIGIRLVNIVVVLFTASLFPCIIRHFNSKLEELEIFLLTSLFLFSPLIFGLITEINIDVFAMCFFIWVVYSHIKKENFLLFVSCILLVFTKETTIVILFVYCFFYLMSGALRNGFINSIFQKNCLVFLSAGGIWLYCTIGIGELWSSVSDSSLQYSKSGDMLNVFGLNGDLIIAKLKELYVMNFTWLFCLIIGISLFMFYKKSNFKSGSRGAELVNSRIELALIGSYISFIFVNLFFITYAYYRYIQMHIFYLIILMAIFLSYVDRKKRLFLIVMCLALSVLSNFFTFDPITLAAFKTVNVGRGNIITTRTIAPVDGSMISTDEEVLRNYYFPQSIIYNRQYLYLERCIEKGMKKINYSENSLILFYPITKNRTLFEITGQTMNDDTVFYWNSVNNSITSDVTSIPILWEEFREDTVYDFDSYDAVYSFVFNCGEGREYFEDMKQSDTITVFSNVWSLNINKIK